MDVNKVEDGRDTYQSSNCDACRNGGDRAGAHVARYATACGEGGEDECDVVEGGLWRSCVSFESP